MTTAAQLDAADGLAGFAGRFAKPPGIYMDGNSLGLMCHAAEAGLRDAVEAWRTLGVRGWTEGAVPWFGLARRASARFAPLLGCDPADVMVGGSTTANLHQLLATFCDPGRGVLIDGTHFPSDRYAIDAFVRSRGLPRERLAVTEPGPDRLLDERVLADRLRGVGFAVLPAVVYTTGQLLDLGRVTAAARTCDTLVAWDCSHSAGVVPHRFRADGVDLAFCCGYKYLSGGPGAAAWLYAHTRLRDRLPGLAGWFGADPARQFEMSAEFHPVADAGRYQVGTPHMFSLAPPGRGAGRHQRGGRRPHPGEVRRADPVHDGARRGAAGAVRRRGRDPARRGGHLTLTHPDAAKLSRALRGRGVVPDFRPPDMLRLAPAPLYTSFAECAAAVDGLERILADGSHRQLPDADGPVT